jgi:hypothetical protein
MKRTDLPLLSMVQFAPLGAMQSFQCILAFLTAAQPSSINYIWNYPFDMRPRS